MIPILIILLLCSLTYYGLNHSYIDPLLLQECILLLTPLFIVMITIDHVIAYRHPLAKKIHSAIVKNERDIGKPIQKKHLIINLSGIPLAHSLAMNMKPDLNMRYHDCDINGYFSHEQDFYLSIFHPHNNIPQLRALWQQICTIQIKFQTLYVCIHPDQLATIQQKLTCEWGLFTHIMQQSLSTMVILNHESFSQAFYYATEYGDSPSIIMIPPTTSVTHLFQSISQQLDRIASMIFTQRHELCAYPPINKQHKLNIFKLPAFISKCKHDILAASSSLNELNIHFHSISLWFNPPPANNRLPNLHTIHRLLTQLILPLTISALVLLLINKSFEKTINNMLVHASGHEQIPYLKKLESYSKYHHIQNKHAQNLKASYLKNFPQHTQVALESMLNSKSSKLKYFAVDTLTASILNPEDIQFLMPKWQKSKTSKQPDYSSIASIIPSSLIPECCKYIYPDSESCFETMQSIHEYYEITQKLQTIQNTLLPIDPENPEQSLRQLGYLAKHQEHIGEKADKELKAIIHTLTIKQQYELAEQARETQSIIALLQSQQGSHILSLLYKSYSLLQNNKTASNAHKVLKSAYMIDNHPLRSLHNIQKSLPEAQGQWLSKLISPITELLVKATHQEMKTHWQLLQPNIQHVLSLYPFNKDAQASVSPEELHTLFGKGQAIDEYYDHYLKDFVVEDDNGLMNNPLNLGIKIPEHILMTVLYTRIIQAAIDIKPTHFHTAFAASIVEHTHPTKHITLINGNVRSTLEINKSTTVHWDSREPIGIDVEMHNGEVHTLIQDNQWSLLTLFKNLGTGNHLYRYQDPNQSWHVTLKLSPQYAIDILSPQLLESIPQDNWN